MSEGLRPYPEYRESGVAWLGRVPAHWEVRRLKHLFHEVDHRTATGTETLLSLRMREGLVGHAASGGQTIEPAALVGYKKVAPTQVVMNRMRASAGLFGVATSDGIVSPDYAVFVASPQASQQYYLNLFKSPAMGSVFRAESKGLGTGEAGFMRLYTDKFGQIAVPHPSREEQAAIVRYLDAADRRIRRYVRAKQRLIALLEEQKRMVVHRAVTRGLDPDAPLKPSGVEWLGEVPAHWQVTALRLRYSVQLGKMLDAKRITGQHLVPYLRNVDVQWDRVDTSDLPVMDVRPDEYDRYTVRTGDLLVCEGGEVGRAALWNEAPGRYAYQKALHRLRASRPDGDHPRFLFFVLLDAAKRGVFQADGSENTIAHLPADKFRVYRFAFPPEDEQRAIARYLDEVMGSHAAALRTVTNEIALLHDFRTRLVADVVTGKLDVRAAAARLPDDAGEPDALNDADTPEEDAPEDAPDLEPAEA